MTRIGLCVDDFGLKPSINQAVAQLVDMGLVTAVGCMSTAPAWREGATELRHARSDRTDVGLHLNLTEGWATNGDDVVMPLPRLILRSLVRGLPRAALERTVKHQLDAFEDGFGAAPDFVDGHQHVHQLPQVRDVLLAELRRRYPKRLPWLRSTAAPRSGTLAARAKQQVIESLGCARLQRMSKAAGHAMNRALLGVYGFDADEARYLALLERWLAQAQDGDLLMMHPAMPQEPVDNPRLGVPSGPLHGDVIAAAREVEYRVLTAHGAQLLQRHGIEPTRISHWARAHGS